MNAVPVALPVRPLDASVRAQFALPRKLLRSLAALVAVGVVTFAAGVIFAPQRLWPNLLLVSYYLLGLGLAGVVFIAIQYASGASWSVALRRIPEAMCAVIPVGLAGILLLVLAYPSVYPWASPHAEAMPAFRRMWLGLGLFRARVLVYAALWILFTLAIRHGSHAQDLDSRFAHTQRNIRLSAVFLVIFGVTYWLASYDWIMSLEPDWSSTIFGIYNFAGLFVSGLAVLTLLVLRLRREGPLAEFISRHHLHDLGKLLFAFTTFWMYLWFSQYMLIWYANISEETVYYMRRLHGFWGPLFVLNIVLNWVVPFLVLLPKSNKQNPAVLAKICIALLVGRWLDLYLMIAPSSTPQPRIGIWEVGLAAGAAGVFGLCFVAALRRAPLLPVNDPYLAESLHYHA